MYAWECILAVGWAKGLCTIVADHVVAMLPLETKKAQSSLAPSPLLVSGENLGRTSLGIGQRVMEKVWRGKKH